MKTPKFLSFLASYLSDWKNWLSHGLVGVALVLIPLLLPIPLHARLVVFALIVALNTLRMKLSKKRAAEQA